MNKKIILVWFRNDLRIHDNEVLYSAIEKADFIVPVYIFDPRYYETNKRGFINTGHLRHDYILQSVRSLKEKLKEIGGDLLIYEGLPEEIIPQLVQKYNVDEVYHHREVAKRETDISEFVEEALWKIKINLRHFIGHTLYHKEDLPFPIKDIPNDFNVFKKKIEKESFVREPIPTVTQIKTPTLEETQFPLSSETNTASYQYGEVAALNELDKVLKDDTKDEDFYIHLSPYLAIGSLSPIITYHKIQENRKTEKSKSAIQVLEGLLRRDHFRFMLKKSPNSFFINSESLVSDPTTVEKWTVGRTEFGSINHLMHQLNKTGNLSYRDRELLGLFFIYEYQQNWLDGAAWFEQQLVDYAPATNYGFWAHLAGQGPSKKNNRSQKDWEKIKEKML